MATWRQRCTYECETTQEKQSFTELVEAPGWLAHSDSEESNDADNSEKLEKTVLD